jgi:NDP-sugar pyrophosphorylase family protein
MIYTTDLFKGKGVIADYIKEFTHPWEIIPKIEEIIYKLISKINLNEFYLLGKDVYASKGAIISKNAEIKGPCIIFEDAEIRQGAYIRGKVIVGKGCVVGNSTEIKNSILFDNSKVPHYNYVGDSILGYMAHMGAGSICSNVKGDKSSITIKINDKTIDTGLKKLGAIIGDYGEIGCNSVLNPGTIIGVGATVYPLSSVRGYVEPNTIYKKENVVIKKR